MDNHDLQLLGISIWYDEHHDLLPRDISKGFCGIQRGAEYHLARYAGWALIVLTKQRPFSLWRERLYMWTPSWNFWFVLRNEEFRILRECYYNGQMGLSWEIALDLQTYG